MVSPAHSRLREATREDHARLEARVDILRRIAEPAGRAELVARFWRLHAAAEAAIAPWLEDLAELDFAARRRTAQLRRDLHHHGLAPTEPAAGVTVASRSEALGLMYVLEGSTLGGKVIRREAEAAGRDLAGLSFLDPYGAAAGARWRSFLDVLAQAEPEAAVAGARAGFRHAEETLCD